MQFGKEEKLGELLNNWNRAPIQLELLLAYLHIQRSQGEVTQAEVLKKTTGLSQKEEISFYREAVKDGPFADLLMNLKKTGSPKKKVG